MLLYISISKQAKKRLAIMRVVSLDMVSLRLTVFEPRATRFFWRTYVLCAATKAMRIAGIAYIVQTVVYSLPRTYRFVIVGLVSNSAR